MKKLLTLLAASVALAGSSHAGDTVMTQAKTFTPLEIFYGTGWYGAIGGGLNLYQDLGSSQTFTQNSRERIDVDGNGTRTITTRRGNKVAFEPTGNGLGGFGGIKLGYVFGTGLLRPAFEFDGFYNGLDTGVDVKVNGRKVGSASARLDTGAFMGNALLRFNYERFQPYLGFGLGYWVGRGDDVSYSIDGNTTGRGTTNSSGGLAWQLVAGADYYFTPKFSTFMEYKFLNYVDFALDNTAAQQLLGLGLRMHF